MGLRDRYRRWRHRHTESTAIPGGTPADPQGDLDPAILEKAKALVSTQPLQQIAQALKQAQARGWTEWDPYHWSTQQPAAMTTPGPLNRLTYDLLRIMARAPIVNAIIATRCNELAEFARPQVDPFSLGYVIEMRDKKGSPSQAALERMDQLATMIQRCGWWRSEDMIGRDNFEVFLRKIGRDSLTYDQYNWEVVPGRGGKPGFWIALPAKQIRRAHRKHTTLPGAPGPGTTPPQPGEVSYVQVIRNVIVADWQEGEICWGVRRPRTDLENCGYGWPELEELIEPVTWMLWALQYNAQVFKQGFLGEGVLGLVGNLPEEQFAAFQREVQIMMSGVANARRIPIVQLDSQGTDRSGGIKWVDMKKSNRDQEYVNWLFFLAKWISATFMFDLAQLGWVFGLEGQKSSMGGAQTPQDRVRLSRDKGLRPMLSNIEWNINRHIIEPTDPDFRFRFAGLDSSTPEEQLDADIKRVKHYLTVNEVRAEHDLEPIEGGDVLLDSSWLTYRQAEQMAGQGAEEGGPVEEGEAPGPQPDVSPEGEQGPPEVPEGAPAEPAAKAQPVPSWARRTYEVHAVEYGEK